ncbi:hypothetical protein BLNAU_19776 [Blattamonas nauphoetae]|uniref:Uncharacterized protein n=1 Tax=Blattamonas nauphoetae TaxID=2049346 RepID=A0ABQ9X0I5_9EUKA|nr:hypothetical protein BLNAU_19776 [Blattamonas nauphoetae]
MRTTSSFLQSSEIRNPGSLLVVASAKNQIERFDDLLASFSDPNEPDPKLYLQSLVTLLQRFLNHLTNDERNNHLLRFGAALSQRDSNNIDIKSLTTIVSSCEDIITLFHTSGLSSSIIHEIQPNHANTRRLVQLAKLSEICPLDPVERILAFVEPLSNQTISEVYDDKTYPLNLLSQHLQHTATFLNAHPDIIDSFLRRLIASTAFSPTLFRHDRHLNLISALCHRPLFDPTFPLHSLLSPRSFTDPASTFFRIASTNPAFFCRFVEKHATHILDLAVSIVVKTVRVVSDEPFEPHCLDFGRATKNWVLLLNAMAEAKMNLTQTSANFSLRTSSLLTLLILCAANTNEELSTAAVSAFSSLFGLSISHSEALLFATPPTFHVNDAFFPRHSQMLGESDHTKNPSQSICAEAGCCVVLNSRTDISEPDQKRELVKLLMIAFSGCLVNALHSATSLPHSFPFFAPELCQLSQQPSVWNDTSRPSTLSALTTLANIEINLAFGLRYWGMEMSQAEVERRDIVCIHLFPFLGPE